VIDPPDSLLPVAGHPGALGAVEGPGLAEYDAILNALEQDAREVDLDRSRASPETPRAIAYVADHPARILIVDDERHNRQLMEIMLGAEGYLLQTAASGEEALAMVARQPPDLILLDIMMPGLDGYQVAARIKDDLATRNIPVIMVSALDDRNSRMLGLSIGAEDSLTKPVDRAELCLRVKNLLRLKAYGDYHDKHRQALRDVNEELQSVNAKLGDAQETISRLLASSPAASESFPAWTKALAAEIAAAIGARAIGIWEVDREVITAVSDGGLSPPSREKLASLVTATGPHYLDAGEGTIVPVTGGSGELCGVFVVSGSDVAWGDTERRLLVGFAHQLGGALEMSRMRRQLVVAEERRVATRRELHERGIATLQICPRCRRCYDHVKATCPEDGATLDSPRPLPYLLLGRYRFLQVLGQGGMGVVFSAHDQKLGRDVAVKLLRPEHFGNAGLMQRFAREAHAVARIQHPGVIDLFDSGELDDGTAFLVMEKLTGRDLRHFLRTFGRGRPAQVARLVRQGCAALGAAHRAGVVHRDVKPENIFLVDDPSGFRVKLLDFGIAKSMSFDHGLTQMGELLGTPAYMSPEHAGGIDVDSRSDVYQFAAVVYEALTGRAAVEGGDFASVLFNVLKVAPPPVSAVLSGISPEVDAAFASALAKDPACRQKDIERWGSSFAEFLETMPVDVDTVGWPGFVEPRAELSGASWSTVGLS